MNREAVSESLTKGLKERRGKLEIIEDVLFVAKNGVRKTEIVYKTNLNFARIASYLQYLEEKGLLEISGTFYKTTSKGKKFLRNYQKLKDVLLTEEV